MSLLCVCGEFVVSLLCVDSVFVAFYLSVYGVFVVCLWCVCTCCVCLCCVYQRDMRVIYHRENLSDGSSHNSALVVYEETSQLVESRSNFLQDIGLGSSNTLIFWQK